MTSQKSQTSASILESGFRGVGDKKLKAMDAALLRELASVVSSGEISKDASVDDLVKIILKHKRSASKEKKKKSEPIEQKEQEEPPPLVDKALVQFSEDEEEPVSSRTRSSIFKKRKVLRICAFNSLKLRLDRDGLEDDWEQLIEEFKSMDVLMISEVRASKSLFEKRALELVRRLEQRSGSKWNMSVSQPSGPGIPEVHIIVVKAPIEIVRSHTLMEIGTLRMSHAPHVCLVDPYNGSKVLPMLVLTSVHMPPESKEKERDVQIARLISRYSDEAEIRLNTPFTDKGAKDANHRPVAHILGGDWNAWVGDPIYEVEKNGFEHMFGTKTDTTAGGRAFDNFVISDNVRNHFAISSRVMEFARPQNSYRGQIGLSDHSPILLELEL